MGKLNLESPSRVPNAKPQINQLAMPFALIYCISSAECNKPAIKHGDTQNLYWLICKMYAFRHLRQNREINY